MGYTTCKDDLKAYSLYILILFARDGGQVMTHEQLISYGERFKPVQEFKQSMGAKNSVGINVGPAR
jgi:hypothetical protein